MHPGCHDRCKLQPPPPGRNRVPQPRQRANHQNRECKVRCAPWSHEITRICCGSISGHFGQPMATLAGPGVVRAVGPGLNHFRDLSTSDFHHQRRPLRGPRSLKTKI
ncbi:hypothetical protein CKAH01_01435 [Colletotrichum kahawae]|uniref:Uncharacterized protein n=1 Tax=Colletotrichum kahawae TaxID=34407 RepID=A0AAD9Y870_COLKA|nr:hypothetical protein CKAH01_01435 [Colletotrichum kahawae]